MGVVSQKRSGLINYLILGEVGAALALKLITLVHVNPAGSRFPPSKSRATVTGERGGGGEGSEFERDAEGTLILPPEPEGGGRGASTKHRGFQRRCCRSSLVSWLRAC